MGGRRRGEGGGGKGEGARGRGGEHKQVSRGAMT